MTKFTHVSFYKFTEVADPVALKTRLKALGLSLQLKGTILVASEGINGMLAGETEKVSAFIKEFQKDIRFSGIQFKFSECETQPFKRMLVKVKKEILTFKEPHIKPHERTGKYIKPLELRQWLRENKDVVLLDTRNEYEIEAGTFKNAVNPHIKHFSGFKEAVADNLAHLKDKKIITFCTGGIRCEKATAYMLDQGFKDVYQIEGGIINYLKETGGEFWDGDCFVFDNRIVVDVGLNEVSPKS